MKNNLIYKINHKLFTISLSDYEQYTNINYFPIVYRFNINIVNSIRFFNGFYMENKKACQPSNSPLPAIPMMYWRGDPHHRYTINIYYNLKKISTIFKIF